MTTVTNDVYQRITNQIVAAIETGVGKHRLPWHSWGTDLVTPRNAHSKKPYRGINVLVLWAAAQAQGYSTGLWATYPQWQELGAQVRRGEKGTLVVFWRVRGQHNDVESSEEESELPKSRGV